MPDSTSRRPARAPARPPPRLKAHAPQRSPSRVRPRTPAGTPEPVRRLGREIRGLRKARGYTLAVLAAKTELSVGYLSLLERDLATPSINALHAISRALGVTISWFFDAGEIPPSERDYVVRRTRRRRLDFSDGIVDELLSPSLDRQLELLASRFPPGSSSGAAPYTHDGEEAGVVIRGKLELWVEGKVFLLEAGDSFGFPSTLAHRYRNPDSEEAEVIWAITPPSY
jgi:transcriptional regulator with XRE-family HTH domain